MKAQQELFEKEKAAESKKHQETLDILFKEKTQIYNQETKELNDLVTLNSKSSEKQQSKIKKKYAKLKEAVEKKEKAEFKRYEKIENNQNNKKIGLKRIKNNSLIDYLTFMVFLLIYAYIFSNLYKPKIYYNKKGVFAEIGLFPWNKGHIFVKWEDLERVGYSQSIISWLFASAEIHIVRRYSGEETVINYISRGKRFSGEVSNYLYHEKS